MDQSDLISIVIPVYNEEQSLPELFERLTDVINGLEYNVEIVLVDDGSTDSSWEIINDQVAPPHQIRGIQFSRNFGHQAAITAGLREATGEAVVILDADLQNPPEIIPNFIEEWEAGHDVVYGVFESRDDPLLKRLGSWLFYNVFLKFTSIDIPKNAADFSLLSRTVVDELNRMPETNRFVRGLRAWVGFDQTGVSYEKPAREDGKSKYTFSRLLKLALDGILSFSIVPLRLAVVFGIVISLCGFGYNVFIVVTKFIGMTPPGWASLASIDLILGGIQLLVLGIIGEYLGRVYDEVKNRPNFIVEDRLE